MLGMNTTGAPAHDQSCLICYIHSPVRICVGLRPVYLSLKCFECHVGLLLCVWPTMVRPNRFQHVTEICRKSQFPLSSLLLHFAYFSMFLGAPTCPLTAVEFDSAVKKFDSKLRLRLFCFVLRRMTGSCRFNSADRLRHI